MPNFAGVNHVALTVGLDFGPTAGCFNDRNSQLIHRNKRCRAGRH